VAGKVVTEVVPASDFWEAKPEHQDYLERYPDGYTCHYVHLASALIAFLASVPGYLEGGLPNRPCGLSSALRSIAQAMPQPHRPIGERRAKTLSG
jgi:hypothetical protein